MPVPELMTWVPPQRRWTRMHKGKRFWISCRALGVPETKEESIQAANAWWRAKQAELDAEARPAARKPAPLEDVATALHGDIQDQLTRILQGFAAPPFDVAGPAKPVDPAAVAALAERERRLKLVELFTRLVLDGQELTPEETHRLEQLAPARQMQLASGIKMLRGETAASPDCTLQAHAEAWLKGLRVRVEAGEMVPRRYSNYRACLDSFKAFIGAEADIKTIDADNLQGFYEHCMKRVAAGRQGKKKEGWSPVHARGVFSTARAFIRWLAEKNVIPLPRNLESRSFRFGSGAKQLQTWTPEEFQAAIQLAAGNIKLALLLMANCGMTQGDVSDLKDTEVDWRAGRITRKRSKTAGCDNAPTVSYKLWPITFEMMKERRSGKERVLLNRYGHEYVRHHLRDDGKEVNADGFASVFANDLKPRLCKVIPRFNRSLKQLRKLGASMLGEHKEYGRFSSYFLAHAPQTMADKHYVIPSQDIFDEAVTWLGEQLGMIDRAGS